MKFLFSLCLLFSSWAQAESLKGIYLNNEGTKALKKNNVSQARQNYLKALSENPENHIARLNLGVTFIYDKEMQKALKEFDVPLKSAKSSDEIRYLASFNKGRAYQDLKKPDEALENYQKALSYKKDSIQAKANIELLMQQMSGQGQEPKSKSAGARR